MAFEIFNAVTSWPMRIEALVSTLAAWGPAGEHELAGLISPGTEHGERAGILRNCIDTARLLGLIEERDQRLHLAEAIAIDPGSRLRGVLQATLLSASKPGDDHYRFCLLLAWLIALSSRAGSAQNLAAAPAELAEKFETTVPGAEQERRVNEEKIRAGLRWAEWLGLGRSYSLGGRGSGRFAPYPRQLLLDFVVGAIPSGGHMAAVDFKLGLIKAYPFIDGGSIAAALPPLLRTDMGFGPAMSESLRMLRDEGLIELVPATDTPASLRLHFDATRASDVTAITEIRRRAAS